MARLDLTRHLAMKQAELTKKVEELTQRVQQLESVSGSGSPPSLSKLSPKRVKQLKKSVAQP